jgi:hypothetical protein
MGRSPSYSSWRAPKDPRCILRAEAASDRFEIAEAVIAAYVKTAK